MAISIALNCIPFHLVGGEATDKPNRSKREGRLNRRAKALVPCVCRYTNRLQGVQNSGSLIRLPVLHRIATTNDETNTAELVQKTEEHQDPAPETKKDVQMTHVGPTPKASRTIENNTAGMPLIYDKTATIKARLGTYRLVTSVAWSKTDARETVLWHASLPTDLLGAGPVQAALEGHYGLKATTCLRITTNANKFSSGALYLSYLGTMFQQDPRVLTLWSRWDNPGVMINLAENSGMEFEIPFMGVEHFWRLTTSGVTMGHVWLEVLDGLGGPQDLTVKVEVKFKDIEVLRPVPVGLHSDITAIEFCPGSNISSASASKNLASSLMDVIAQVDPDGSLVADVTRKFPEVMSLGKKVSKVKAVPQMLAAAGAAATGLVEGAAGALVGGAMAHVSRGDEEKACDMTGKPGGVATSGVEDANEKRKPGWLRGIVNGVMDFFGFSRPITLPNIVTTNPTTLKSCVDGPVTSVPLGISVDQKLQPVGRGEDMLLHRALDKWHYYDIRAWNDTDAVGSSLTSRTVHALNMEIVTVTDDFTSTLANNIVGKHVLGMDRLSYVASCFELNRGPLQFRFTILSSSVHSGVLRISYIGMNEALPSNLTTCDKGMMENLLWNIETHKSVEIEVPYLATADWMDPSDVRGNFNIDVYSPLVAPGDSQNSIGILIERSGRKMNFASPRPPMYTVALEDGSGVPTGEHSIHYMFPIRLEGDNSDSVVGNAVGSDDYGSRPFVGVVEQMEDVPEDEATAYWKDTDLSQFEKEVSMRSDPLRRSLQRKVKTYLRAKPEMSVVRGDENVEANTVGYPVRSIGQLIKRCGTLDSWASVATLKGAIDPYHFTTVRLSTSDTTLNKAEVYYCDYVSWFAKMYTYMRGGMHINIEAEEDARMSVVMLHGKMAQSSSFADNNEWRFWDMHNVVAGRGTYYVPYMSRRRMTPVIGNWVVRVTPTQFLEWQSLQDQPYLGFRASYTTNNDVVIQRAAADDFELLGLCGVPACLSVSNYANNVETDWTNKI